MDLSTKTFPWYGRKWKIQVQDSSGNEVWTVSDSTYEDVPNQAALRVKFKFQAAVGQSPFFSEIEVWNFNGDTSAAIIKQGDKVKVEAGYKDGVYGLLFQHQVFQPMFERVDVTDFVTTLNCMDSYGIITEARFSSFGLGAGYNYNDVVAAMAKNAYKPFDVGYISPTLRTEKSPRGMVYHGDHKEGLRQIARDNNVCWLAHDDQAHMVSLNDLSYSGTALVITPQTGLVGTPQLTDEGIYFRCLLNPDIKIAQPLMVIKIDQAVIRQLKAVYGQTTGNQLRSVLDQDGLYKVIGVTYLGDTRGNDWYVDVRAVNLDIPIISSGKGNQV
jgi:hypothetical protein